MKLIIAVWMVRVIISIFEKDKKVIAEKNDSRKKIIHPAEFEIR